MAQQPQVREQDAIIAALRPVIEGVTATFGAACETVLHDFRRPEHSVAAIAGEVTGRGVGSAMSEIGMGLLAEGDSAADKLNYVTRTPSGRLVKSSTMLLRDSAGAVFGAFCVNLDITALERAHAVLGGLVGVHGEAEDGTVPTTSFGEDIGTVLDAVVDNRQLRDGRPWEELSRGERLDLFQDLDEHGVFAVRRAVPRVAARLGVSRATAYHYLSESRGARGGRAPQKAGPQ